MNEIEMLTAEELFLKTARGEAWPIGNKLFDDALVKTGWISGFENLGSSFWTGTFYARSPRTIHGPSWEWKDQRLGSRVGWRPGNVEYLLSIFDEKLQDEKNVLVCFDLIDNKTGELNFKLGPIYKDSWGGKRADIKIVENALFVVKNFPSTDGIYQTYNGIPYGEGAGLLERELRYGNPYARFLHLGRQPAHNGGPRTGLLLRTNTKSNYRTIDASDFGIIDTRKQPSFGVLELEFSEGELKNLNMQETAEAIINTQIARLSKWDPHICPEVGLATEQLKNLQANLNAADSQQDIASAVQRILCENLFNLTPGSGYIV